jgi:alpha/beta superfamily hydrolase
MHEINEFSQQSRQFFLSGPAGKLEVMTTWPAANVKNIVAIICHPHPLYQGSMQNKVVTIMAKTFDQLGLKTLRFNFRGVGKSEGKYGERIGETEDLYAIYHWVKQVLPDHQIWLSGFSFGGYIAAKVASEVKVPQLVTIAPGITHHDFHTLSAVSCPWLIVQGDADEITPFPEVKAFVTQYPGEITFRVISGASHFFHGRLMELKDILISELSHHF